MDTPARILIIRFSSIGDIVLASPVIRCLRSAFPASRIDFLVKSEFADLVKYNPHLSAVLEFQSHGQGATELRSLARMIRRTRYDAVIDIHNSIRSRFIRLFSGARYTGVVNKRVVARFALTRLKWNLYRDAPPVAERYLEAVRDLGVRDDGAGLEIAVPDRVIEAVAARMAAGRPQSAEPTIGLAPMSRHFTKRWPAERWIEFGSRCATDFHVKLAVFGGPEEREACESVAGSINRRTGRETATNHAGELSLIETAAALDACSLVISNDTGLLHLAAARKKRVVGIFGSTVREFGFLPYGTPGIVVENHNLPCRPCSPIGRDRCPRGHFKCMMDIGVEEVATAAREILASPAGLAAAGTAVRPADGKA